MEIPSGYQKEQFLNEAFGNNAFNYNERATQHPEPYLRVAPVRFYENSEQALENLASGVTPAFEIWEEEQLKSFPGLRVFLMFPSPANAAPIFVFDNHNHAFFFWHWYSIQKQLPGKFTLIHVDQHKDTRMPANFLTQEEAQNEQTLQTYTNEILNVGNFIQPAIKTGVINEVNIVDSSTTLEDLIQQPLPDHYILDIDLDFFSPDLDYIDNSLKVKAIKKALTKASIVTVATSPYFIKDETAFNYLKKILS